MNFIVAPEVFALLPEACFGVVVVKGVDNTRARQEIEDLLTASVRLVSEKFQTTKVKEAPEILPYREAFQTLGINPNKYMSSIEAMSSRIAKQKDFPRISPLVDLVNAISLKHLVPMGAHDLAAADGDIQVRLSRQGDSFIPFGSDTAEGLADGELIYSAGSMVKTRRWIWRQSEQGCVTAGTRDIFFPIDGFYGQNEQRVTAARDELAVCLERLFAVPVTVGMVDRTNSSLVIS